MFINRNHILLHVVRLSDLVIVKLGGSVITHKEQSPPQTNQELLIRIAKELKVHSGRLVIILGGGAHGHQAAHKFGFGDDTTPRRRLLEGVPEIRHNMTMLSNDVEEALSAEGIPAVVFSPFNNAKMQDGQLLEFPTHLIQHALDAGHVVVTHGDVCFDETRGASILSGETITVHLAKILKAKRILIGTNVDGVLEEDPNVNPDTQHIPIISSSNKEKVLHSAGPSGSTDVTGGMNRKITELFELVHEHSTIAIFNLKVPGRLLGLLEGTEVICTRILL